MSTVDDGTTIVLWPGEGMPLPRPDTGGTVTMKLSRRSTEGALSIWESARAAGDTGGPDVHSHPGFDEAFYVLAGEYEFVSGGKSYRAPAGTFLFIRRGTFHRFASVGGTEGRLLALASPGGIEDFFEEMAVDPEAKAEVVGKRHGLIFGGQEGTH